VNEPGFSAVHSGFVNPIELDAHRIVDPVDLGGDARPDEVTFLHAESSGLFDDDRPRPRGGHVRDIDRDQRQIVKRDEQEATSLASEDVLIVHLVQLDASIVEDLAAGESIVLGFVKGLWPRPSGFGIPGPSFKDVPAAAHEKALQ
jgi:hypothetical protein